MQIMKPILYSVLALAAAVLLIRCATAEEPSTIVYVLSDETELHTARPSADELMPLFGLTHNKWAGAEIAFSAVTDVSYNRRTSFTLPKGTNRLTASGYTRDRDIRKFRDSIDTFLTEASADTVGRPYSSIYLPMAEALNELAARTATHRFLVLYSDMMENSQELSFYDKRTIRDLRGHPEKVRQQLASKLALGKYDGITVYIVFEPKDAAEDELFRLASGFYKALLEEHGTHVIIAANIPSHANTHEQ